MSERTIRVLSVDDHRFLADGLRARFEQEPDLELVGWVGSAENLPHEVESLAVDIVLLDIEMPGPDPFEALADLVRIHPEVRVIMFSAFMRDHYLDVAVKAGAWGYLSKGDEPEDIIGAIRSVAGGEFAFSSEVVARGQRQSIRNTKASPRSRLDTLTPRELQVLRMIGRGMSRAQIAEELHRSPKTVDVHRGAIMEKLQISDRAVLVRYALREGLAEL